MKLVASLALGGAVLGLFAAGSVIAAAPQTVAEVVKHRQDTMKRQLNDVKTIKAYLDGKGSLADAQAGAADLTKTSELIPTLFPQDTGMAQDPKSHAKPIIWQDWNKFIERQRILVAKTETLAAAARSGNRMKIAAAFADAGKNGCGGCHTTFRAPLKNP